MAAIKTYQLRHQAAVFFKRSVLLALLIHLFGLVSVPEYKIKVRSFTQKEVEAIELPVDLKIPEKQKTEVPRPTIPVEAEEDEDVPEDSTIEETVLDEDIAPPEEPPPVLPKFGTFVAYDSRPEPIKYVTPEYPELAKQAGIEGTVLAQLLVGTDGKVYDVVVQQGPEIFYENVKIAARRCVFTPAKQRDKPVAVWVAVPFVFSLREARG